MMHLQFHQVLNLLFLIALASFMDFLFLGWGAIVLLLLSTLIIEHLFIYLKTKQLSYLSFSSLATSMGVMLMMVSSHWYIYFMVIALGLMQKHFLTYRGYHFFNPSNFAVVVALLLFYDEAHIITGQLGDMIGLAILVIILGAIILWRAKRWIIPVVFLGSYLLFQYFFVMGYDPVLTMDEITHRFYSVSFIVFILFMLTDPRATPELWYQQIIFAIIVAFGATMMDRYIGFRVQHLFLSLFFLSLFVPLVCVGSDKSKKGVFMTALLAILALAVIISVEMQAPYYFDMNG